MVVAVVLERQRQAPSVTVQFPFGKDRNLGLCDRYRLVKCFRVLQGAIEVLSLGSGIVLFLGALSLLFMLFG